MAGRRAPRKIYWDTCVFLAWIKQETCWPEDVIKGIEQIAEQSRKEVVILTSVITLAEILQSDMTIEQKDKFAKAFSDPQLQLIDVDRRISSKAATIRQDCDTRTFDTDGSKKSGSIMAMGDALHLATAIHFNVDEFQTLDGAGKAKRLDLLRLDGNVALSRLAIRQPKYVPPPAALEGPLIPTVGSQQGLFDPLDGGKGNEVEHVPIAEQEKEPATEEEPPTVLSATPTLAREQAIATAAAAGSETEGAEKLRPIQNQPVHETMKPDDT